MWRLALLAIAFLAAAEPSAAETFQAQVVDAETGRPIEEAIVLARWLPLSGPSREVETETDTQGRFTLDRPDAPLREHGELVVVYKFGYVVWINSFPIHVDDPPRVGEAPRPSEPRSDTRVPPRILLTPVPVNGNRPAHFWYLNFIVDGDGQKQRRPKFWNAIQHEEAAAKAQIREICRNRTDCD